MLITQVGTGQPNNQQQDPAEIRLAVEQFLHTQTKELYGQNIANVGKIDSRVNLVKCMQLELFLPTGSCAWGKHLQDVRCTSPRHGRYMYKLK